MKFDGNTLALVNVLKQAVFPQADWRVSGQFIQVRDRTWYFDRLAEVPDRVLKPLAERLRRTGILLVDDAATLALMLRDEQMENLGDAIRDEGLVLGQDAFFIPRNWDGLRVYASLTREQRERLRATRPILVAEMPVRARQWLSRFLERCGGGKGGNCRITTEPTDPPPASLWMATNYVQIVKAKRPDSLGISLEFYMVDTPGAPLGMLLGGSGFSNDPTLAALAEGGQVFQGLTFVYEGVGGPRREIEVELPAVSPYRSSDSPSPAPAPR